ncbi:hypothetical protein [Helcococcus bovis]|uniref:hypothetical protein n=1 Tax=Helcococcus bovis TaxID=3153252 RepID=UPI0038BB46C5
MQRFFTSIRDSISYKRTSTFSERVDRRRDEESDNLTYEDLILKGFRYITTDLKKLEAMTLAEFKLQIEAYFLRKLDNYENNAQLALMIRKSNETEKKGKKEYYKHNSIEELIDIKAIENNSNKRINKNNHLYKIAQRVKEINKRKGVK